MTVYDHQKPVTGPLSFRHFYTVEYRPGEDELINYRAKKRKNGAMYESVEIVEDEEKDFKPHMMYKDNSSIMADTYKKHLELKKKGYGHTKPKKKK